MTTYTPAQAAERTGFSVETLRYYEREGILHPIARTASGRREFTDDDLGTLHFLSCLRDTAMPIALMRRYGALAADPATMRERMELVQEHAATVAEQVAVQRSRLRRLEEKVEWYRGELESTG